MLIAKRYIPNIISLLRVVLTIPFILLINTAFINDSMNIYSKTVNAFLILCFLLILLSDIADGYLARKMNFTSNTGLKLDIAADLFYVLGTVGILVRLDKLPIWFFLVLLTNFLVFIGTSKAMLAIQKDKVQKSVIFDRIGKSTAILTMLLPGVFVFRNLLTDAICVMRIGALIITSLFCISIIHRIILSARVTRKNGRKT